MAVFQNKDHKTWGIAFLLAMAVLLVGTLIFYLPETSFPTLHPKNATVDSPVIDTAPIVILRPDTRVYIPLPKVDTTPVFKTDSRYETKFEQLLSAETDTATRVDSDILERFAMETQYPPALHRLGVEYYKGKTRERNFNKAYALISKAAELGFEPSKYMRGAMLINGTGCARNYDLGFAWIRSATTKVYEALKESNKMFILNRINDPKLIEGHSVIDVVPNLDSYPLTSVKK